MAAVAEPRASATIPISVSTTPKKEARARAAQKLGKDLAYFFSGDYLSACDLSTALARLIPAVVRGDVKPRAARTVAYLAQTLPQSIHISQHEYINAFGSDGWRKSIRNSVTYNHDYRFPPAPKSAQPAATAPRKVHHDSRTIRILPTSTPARTNPRELSFRAQRDFCAPGEFAERGTCFFFQLATRRSPLATSSGPATSPLPPTSAEFVQHVMAGLPPSLRPGSTGQTGGCPAPHPAPSPTSAHASQTPASRVCHPERSARSEGSQPIPPNQSAPSASPAARPNEPQQTRPSAPQPAPNRDAHALHFDHNCRLLIDGKPV